MGLKKGGFASYITLFLFFLFFFVLKPCVGSIVYLGNQQIDTSGNNTEFIIPLKINNTSNLYAFRLDITYTGPIILDDFEEGGFLSQDGSETLNSNDLGLLEIGDTYANYIFLTRKTTPVGISGDGTLANLHFLKTGEGISRINIETIELLNASGDILQEDYYTLQLDVPADQLFVNQSILIIANFHNSSGQVVIGSCFINESATTQSMQYSEGYYSANIIFDAPGIYPFEVTCNDAISASSYVYINDVTEQGSDEASSSGGGASGVASSGFVCNSDWVCSSWSPEECSSLKTQTRTCIDNKKCLSSKIETRSCELAMSEEGEINSTLNKPESIKCGNGILDQGENYETCCIDAGCGKGYECVEGQCLFSILKKTPLGRLKLGILLILIFTILIIFMFTVWKFYQITQSRNIKDDTMDDPEHSQDLARLKDYMRNAELKGIPEKELNKKLRAYGWDPKYIKQANIALKKEKSLTKK